MILANRCHLWGGVLLTLALCSVANADGERKILHKEKVSPSSGHVFMRYDYYVDDRGWELKHGLETWWDEDGKKTREVTYVDGLQNGPDITYDILGDVSLRGQWKGGAREGKWEGFSGDKLRSVETYVQGRHVGSSKYWNWDGILVFEEHFDDRGRTAKRESFFDDGSKQMRGTFAPVNPDDWKTVKSGTWTYWNRAGQVIAEGVWKEGKPVSGICGEPAAGDAGSAGIENFGRYENGKLVERVVFNPHNQTAPQPIKTP